MNIHFIVHESFEAPGAYETWVSERGHQASHTHVYAGQPLPSAIESIDLLVVLGGPQSPATTLQECPHFDSAAEQALIAACIAAHKAVVGVCLGAQLIGAALGAACQRSPEKEIGKFPITLTDAGRKHEKFAHFITPLEVGHWHSDMPGLTADARVLASSLGCPHQIIEYGRLVYGFQCHMEFTPALVEQLIAASAHEWSHPYQARFVQTPAMLRNNDYRQMNHLLFGFLDRLMADYSSCRSA